MFFTLLFTASIAFTVNVISVVAYQDESGHEYMGLEPVNEKLKGIPAFKQERKEEVVKNNTITFRYPTFTSSSTSSSKPKVVITTPVVENTKPKNKPIKVIHDDWFMKHYDRICQLEAISHRSVLDMYDHEDIFKQFSDLKMLARNLAWEQQQARTK